MRTSTALRLAAGLLFTLAFGAAWAQQVLTTLPSNMAGGTILVNPITNKIYMVGSSSIEAFDGATHTKTLVDGENNQTTAAIDPITNKVYIGRGASPTGIIVVDGATNTRTTDLDPGGQSVGAMAINPVTHKLYVSRPGGNELTVIDTLNGNSITRVTTGLTNPQKIAVDAVANKVYVTSGTLPEIYEVYEVDGVPNVATITLTGNLEAIAVNPVTGKVYVTKSNSDLVEVDGTTHVATTIAGNPTLSTPRTIAINPVTNKVYAFSFPALPSTVTVIDGATPAMQTSINVSPNPNAMVVDPVANRLYVVNQGGSVDVIDCNTNTSTALTVAAEPGAQFFSVGVNPVTGRVYAGNQVHQSVWVIDRSTYEQTTALKSGAAAVNPITGKIYLAAPFAEPSSPANRTLTVVDAATGGVTAIDLGVGMTQMRAVAVDPLLNQVYVTTTFGRLAIVNGATDTLATPIIIFSPTGDLQDLVVNPVTHKVYIANASTGANDVKIVNGLTNTQVTAVVTGGGSPRIALNAETNQVFAILDRPQHGPGNPRSQVAVIDGASDALLKVVELGMNHTPQAIAVNPVTNGIYVATNTSGFNSGGALEIVGSTLGNPSPTVNTLPLGVHHGAAIAVNPVTNTVWVGSLSGGMFMIDPATVTVTPLPGTDSSAVNQITVDTVRNKVYGTQYGVAHIIAVDGATASVRTIDVSGNTGTGGPNFPGPGKAVVDHTTGKVWVPCDHIGCANTVILDPAPGTFDKHQPGVTLVGGLGGATSAAAPSLSVTTSGTYSPSDPAVQKLYFRQGDSQGSHSTASGLGPYTAALSGLSKGLNYVSLFALDAMAGTSTSTETGASPASFGANPTMTGAARVFAFAYTGPPDISTASLPGVNFGASYNQTLTTYGGVGTIAHTVTSGALPNGLSLSSGGTISGTANAAGPFNFTVTATDGLGSIGTKVLEITVDPPPAVLTLNPATTLFVGAVLVGNTTTASSVTVTNNGGVNLTVGTPTITGTSAADFTLFSNNCTMLAPAASCTLQFTFTPTGAGARAATVTVPNNGGGTTDNVVDLAGIGVEPDTTPDAFSFTDVTGVPRSSVQTSAFVTISGIHPSASISISGGSYSIGCTGPYVTTASTITNHETVCVRHTAAATHSANTDTTLTVGGVSDTFRSTTLAGFQLAAATGGNGTGSIAGTGIACPGDCTERFDPGTAVSLTATPAAGSLFTLWNGCTTAPGTTCNVTMDADKAVIAQFTAGDTTPNAFSFTDHNNVDRNTLRTSGTATIQGINVPAPISVTGGEYSIGCNGTFTAASSTISNNTTVCVRHTTASANSTATNTTLTVGGVSDTWTTTTLPGFTLTAAVAGTGSGTITGTGIACPGDCNELFDLGTSVSLSATPAAGTSSFAGWGGACTGTGACNVSMDAAKSVTATFNASVPGISINPGSLAFGGQSMGTTSPPLPLQVTNTGSSDLVVSGVTIDSAQYSQTSNCGTVAPAASCTINVRFTPAAAAGAVNAAISVPATLTIASNLSPAQVSLTGTAQKSFVSHYYRSILGRAPDAGGAAFWAGEAARVAALGANVNEVWFALAQAFYFSPEYLALNRTNTGFITDVYTTFFNRAPDQAGLDFWVGQLVGGMPREVALASFMFSTEFANFTSALFGNTAARAEVDAVGDFYRGLLARLPDDGGFNFWVGRFRTAQCSLPASGRAAAITAEVEAISSAYALSQEYTNRARTHVQYVGDLYNAFLRRGGDLTGVLFWINQVATGAQTREQVRVQFRNSTEFQARVQAIIAQGCVN